MGTEGGSSWESKKRMCTESRGAEARTGLTGDGLRVPPIKPGPVAQSNSKRTPPTHTGTLSRPP